MIRQSFGAAWRFSPWKSTFEAFAPGNAAEVVTLPHDAMLTGGRSAEGSEGMHTGYHRAGSWQYEKDFEVPEAWATKRVTFEFEGVYRDAMVYINGAFAGQWANGYSTFHVQADPYLLYGQTNTIKVEARSHRDSRWYTGAGIYRPVHLLIGELVHITPTGLRVTTPEVDAELAVAAVSTQIRNEGIGTRTVAVVLEVRDSRGDIVATDHARATVLAGEQVTVRQRAYIHDPLLWDVDNPNLYTATVRLTGAEGQVDEAGTTFGIRTVSADPVRGLRINGRPVKLRGACVHHDNGVIGAAGIARAEERRVQLLKAAGFNAIRSAHNPLSTAMLEACDRLGMLVMDETFDMWTRKKTDDDYARHFPEWWERDVDALVAKDFNHPSVIMYSIGNEILEIGTPHGARWGRRLAERVRAQDPTRLVTNAINGMMALDGDLSQILTQDQSGDAGTDGAGPGAAADGGFNSILGQLTEVMPAVIASPVVGERIAESAALLDVVGLNYGESRYLIDREQFPNRVVVGSETFPSLIERYWQLVTQHPHVIGDFTWTGWDYLGEAGLGRVVYPGEEVAFGAPFPWLTASAGDIDITGRRRPVSYYREIVYGLRTEPYLAVQRPEHREHPARPQAWTWTDTVASWTWDVPPGTTVTVEAYADADEVEFVLNGTPAARVPVGTGKAYVATADLPYEPGTLEAVGYRAGAQIGRCRLVTADSPVRVRLSTDREQIRPDHQDLAFLDIALVDEHGTVNPHLDRAVTVEVSGPALLQGLGTARPVTEESFLAAACTTYQGHALAVLRPDGTEGAVTVTVHAEGCPPAAITFAVGDLAEAGPGAQPLSGDARAQA
ncbi:glycoside hydrolase family 2 TIM barrel-domain containing protein [Dactylosporangium sp. CA-233914]|uniref:glycoside hydrolase family 2 TIM barrel-domain containing protein n=1 Tax=Dactylosporangium sp. CA-233914 TaxID=3239934 RepID=UPI003D92644C